MIRSARPGDRCFLLRDPEHDGRNIGKTCVVLEQCACSDTDWRTELLEPWVVWEETEVRPGFWLSRRARCPAGTHCCIPKPDLRPITDPDQENDDVSHLPSAERDHADSTTTR